MYMYIYIYIYIYVHHSREAMQSPFAATMLEARCTPGLHNKIPAYNIFARGWVAQKSFFS